MKRNLMLMFLVAMGLAMLVPGTAHAANERDIDFDWIANTLDKLLASYCPGISIKLNGADNDGNGIWEEDSLAMLAAVLRGGTRVGTTCISAANADAIRADFAANRTLVENDMLIYGEFGIIFVAPRIARTYTLGAYGSDKLVDMLRAELGPVGGDLTTTLLLDYFAGLVTIGEAATFTHLNTYIGQILDGLCAGMGNQDLGGVANMWNVLRQEKTARALYLTTATYNATRWGTGGSRPNLFGAAGNFDSTGTVTDAVTNITEYTAAGSNRATWRENFLTSNGMLQNAMRVVTPPVGTPEINHVLNGDMTNGAGAAPTQWTLGANWASNPQDDIAAVAAPQGLFLVMRHTAGSTAELTQTQAQQPASNKITAGVTYRVEFAYKWIEPDDAIQTANGISVALGTAVSGVYTSTNENWHNETVYLTAAGANPSFRFIPTLNFAGYVDNVWVKIAALAGDPLSTGTVGVTAGVAPITQAWENAENFPSSSGYNRLNNDSFKGNTNFWTPVNCAYANTGNPLNLIPLQRVEKTAAGVATLTQLSTDMEEPLVPNEWYTVSYFLYQTAGTITPNLSGTNLATRSYVHPTDLGVMVSELVQNGTGTQQLTFNMDSNFRGRIYWVYTGRYNNFALHPYYTGSPAGSLAPDFVADGVLGDPNDNGYRGVVPSTKNLLYTYLLPSHDGMAPWLRLSDSSAYTSSTVYNPPDRAATVPTGSIGGEALGGRTTAMIKIQVGPRAFAIQPQPTTPIVVGTGNPFSMTSAAVGGDSVPRYQWYKGNPGDTSTPVGTAFSGTYSVASAVPASAGTYFMRATNLLGFLDSNPVTVTISTPVTISGQPAGGNKAVGGTHTFSVTASGGAGALTYNLYKGGVLTSTNGTGSFTLNPLVAGDQANYYITVTDGASTATSSTVSLTVLAIGTQPVAPAAQTSGADGVTMTTVIAAGSGSGAYGYLWYKSTDGGGTWATTGITTSVLTFNNIMVTDAGMYRCTVNDAFATLISNAVTLGVTAAAITAPALANQTLSVSQPAAQWNATPTAGGSGPGFTYSYLWQKSTDGGATWGSLGVTTATYTPPTALPADAGMYRCQIGETPGTRPPSAYVYTTGGTLTLNSINVTASAPGAASVWVSQTATFTSTLGASYGNVSYQWEFSTNGGATWAIVLGGTNATGTNVAPGPQTYTTVATTLAMNTYQYRVRVTSFGQPTQITPSAGAVLTVNQVVPAATATTPAAPTLTVSQTQLLSSTISQPGPAGTTMSYLWQKSTDNGATWNTIAATAGTTTTTPSAQNYTVPAVAFTDNGAQFRIAVTVVFGGSTNTVYSAPAVITVIHPTLTGSQPGDQTRYVGLTAIFTSTVTATVGQVTYQWQVSTDGGATYGDIGGATATVATGTAVNYTTPTLALTDNNKKYRVKLTSPIDASMPVVYSAAGTLTVNTNTISVSAVSPAAPTIYVNATQLYTATPTSTATGANALEYIWERSTNGGTTWTPIGAYAPATSGAPVNYTTPVQATPSANQTFHVIVRVAAQTTVNATSGPASLTVNATTPAITVQPVSATINVGATNTFTCTATVPVGTISAQWQRSDDGGTTWNPVGAAIPGVASGATVSFATPVASVTVDNGDRYRCVLTSSNDSTSITTNTLPVVAAILTVNNLALNIAPNPAAADRYVGQTAVFTTGATGGFGTITYQWQVSTDGGTVWNNVAGGSGAATASYTTAALVVGDNNKLFRCRVGDGVKPPDAYQYSGTALLHVQPVLSLAGLTGANLIENSPIALSVTPTGGYAPLSYQWEFNPGTGWVNLGGPTPSATYSVANAFFVNEGQYRVTVTDNLSTTAAAGPVTVTVLEISADPASIGRTAGQNYTPTVTVVPTSGNGAVTYQWQVSTNSGTTWNNVVADARHLNVTTNALTINALVVGDAGWYRCVVRDNGGTGVTLPSGVSVLTVTANPIVPVTQPLAGSRYPTQNYTFTAEASGGVGTRSYQWKFSTDGGTTWGNVGAVQTTVPATLALTGLTAANGGRYKCTVTDQSLPTAQTLDLGGLTGVLLTITPAAVAITAEPVDRNILVTQNTTFGVTATNGGTVGTVTYQWESSANGSTGWANVAGGSGGASATYTTPTFAAPQNGPYYRCVLQNNANAVGAYLTYSAVVYLTVSWVTITVAPQPAPSTVWASQNATFTTGATSTIGTLSYQWQFNPGTGFVNTGAPGATLNITGAQAANAGSYQCVISNSANVGGPTQTSNAVVLTVLSTTPSITTGPASQSAYVSQTLTFGAVASLPTTPPGVPGGMTHQWQVSADNGATWNPVVGGSGASTASYTTATLTAADNAKQFRCVVTSTANSQSVNSSAATATVNATPAAATAVAPASVSKYVTETAGPFTSTVSAPYGTVSYVWQKKLSAGAWNDILGTSVSNAATGAVASYTTPALLAADDNSSYRVHVTSDADASTADSGVGVVTLLVATPTYGAINNPSVLASQTATLSVVANVPVGNLNYQWQISTDGGATWGSVTGGTGGSGSGVASGTTLQYTTPALTTANDNGKYRAQVTAVADSTVNVGPVGTVNVTLGAIVITGQPAGANKLAGGSLTMTVTATNDLAGGLTYQWQSSPDGTTWGDLADAAGHIAGASTDSLALTGLLLADKGYYRCLVGDAGRAGADRVATNGGAFLDVRTPVNITVPPAGANKKMGDSHTFTITAQDGYTPYTYKWLRGAAQIGSNSDTLALTNLTYADQGAYTCEITGAGGTTTASVPVDLTVLEIQTQPLPQTASVHGSATFSVAVTASSGLPGYTYQWKYLGADIAGAIGDTLTLSDVQAGSPDGSVLPINPAGSAGAYQCAVMDNAGVVLDSAVAALTVNSTPLAVTAPVSGRVHIGDSFSFTVTASDGYGPAYTYQWQQDGSDLSGETSATLNISSATPASAGSYVCRVGEQDVRPPLALVDSLAGTLQVAPPVSITGEPAGADLYVGESFTATVAATGGFGVISHQWYKDGVPMPGETGDTLTIDPVALGDAASYTAAATDEDASTATSQAAELTVVPHVSVTAHPAGGQMQLGTPFMLTVAGAGGKGMLHYAWYKGAVQVGPDSATYTITAPGPSDVGSYHCMVYDSATPVFDSALSDAVTVSINVVFGFSVVPQPNAVYVGDTVTLLADTQFVTGSVTYTWYDPAGAVIPQSLFDAPNTRKLANLQPAQSGDYYVVAVDDMGTPDPADDLTLTSPMAKLTVAEHLSITKQPESGMKAEGDSVVLTVETVGGVPPLIYEWRVDGANTVVGDEATLTLSGLTAADEGTYYVTIMDANGESVESDHVLVKVISGMPVAAPLGLALLAAGMALAGRRVLRRKC